MGVVNLFAHITDFCTSRCHFCYQKNIHTSRTCMSLQLFEEALERFRPAWVILLGGEPTLAAFDGWHGPRLHEYVAVARRLGAQVAVQTSGVFLKRLPDLHTLVDRVTVSMDYVSTLRNRSSGRWNNGTTLEDILEYASQRPNVEFTSTYLGDNLSDIMTIAEWSVRRNRQYLIKADKTALLRRSGESMDDYMARLADVRKDMTALFRSVYMLHLAYGLDPYRSPIMIEEPSYIVFLNVMTGRRVRTYCPAGREMVLVRPDGRITPCPLGLMFNYVMAGEFKPVRLYSSNPPSCRTCKYNHEFGCDGCPAMGNVAVVCPMYTYEPEKGREKPEAATQLAEGA
jgi:MoaA/NifB/PqqE/SkfB family radical SAM enzyme